MVATSDPQPWMKKGAPDELVVVAYADEDCPLDASDLTKLAETVLAKSDIRRVDKYEKDLTDISSNVYLLISLYCLPERAPEWVQSMGGSEEPFTEPGENFVVLQVDFGGLVYYSPSETTWARFDWYPSAGFVGKGSGPTLENLVKKEVKDVVKDYVSANSDQEKTADDTQ